MWKKIQRPVMLLSGLAALVLLCGASLVDNFIYHPLPQVHNTPEAFNIKYEELSLTSASGLKLNAWHVPGKSQKTFLIFSGNAGNISVVNDRLVSFYQMGYSSFAVDYPGFGSSEGRPDEAGTYEAAEAAWNYLTGPLQLKPEQIIVYGFSLGGGVGSWLAAKYPPAALILDSTFTRLVEVARKHFPDQDENVMALLGDAYDTASRLADIHGPLLVLHSKGDRVVPYALGVELFEMYQNGPKRLVSGEGDHMDFMLNRAVFLPAIRELADSLPAIE